MLRLFPLLVLLLAGLALARPWLAPPAVPDPAPAVGWVLARDVGRGSGWVLDAEKRLLVTCWHVVGDNDAVEVVFPVKGQARRAWYLEHLPKLREQGQAVKGKVVHRDAGVDLALVELASLPPGVTALPLAANGVGPGDRVHAVGNRYDTDLLWLRASGWVRRVEPLKDGYFTAGKQVAKAAWVVDARVPINEGDSGGPLLDGTGRVVGVAAAVAWEHQGSGYFIDRRELVAFLQRAGKVAPVAERPAEPPASARDVYRGLLPSAVLVLPRDTQRRGGGWVVDRDRRLVLTGAELLRDRKAAAVRFPFAGSEPATGVVIARDDRRNLALLELDRLPKDAVAATLADDEPSPGDPLHAVTHASRPDFDWLYQGTLLRQAGPAKVSRDDGEPPRVLLLQAQPADGEEGSPVVDNRGRVVGQHAGKGPPQQQVAYAVAAGEVRDFLKEHQARWRPETEADRLSRARLFRDARAEERALDELDRAVAAFPNAATACGERAGLLLHLGRVDAARADADRAVKLAPDRPAGWCRRAEIRAERGDLAGALVDSDNALSLDRESADVHRVRAGVLRRLGRLNEALAHADEAVWFDRKNAAGYRVRGWVHLDRDDAARALDDLDMALKLDDEDAVAYRLRGEAKLARGDARTAEADFDAALRRRPDDAAAWLGRGRATGSTDDCTQAIARDPYLAAAYLERGGLRLVGTLPGLGLDDLTEAVRLRPALRDAALSRARRAVRAWEAIDLATAARIAVGAVARLVPLRDGRVWWDLPDDPAGRLAAMAGLLGL